MAILYDLSGMPIYVPQDYVEIFKHKIKLKRNDIYLLSNTYFQNNEWVNISESNPHRIYSVFFNKGVETLEIKLGEDSIINLESEKSIKIDSKLKIAARSFNTKIDYYEIPF
ncbi:hypothetical protein F7734_55750 [Scytonema sp. UIC 10036]|uniref:hypothetical protein n=1 Tax=Scytonema sp. UIC 10036 TaxID=2304196 RepID=UPI0012DADCAF|nr:hypothetical protein [Scytonema sp. UIC 10036]MUH01035.1 hypothetical protein [Scytonema sp. UIC 10036]